MDSVAASRISLLEGPNCLSLGHLTQYRNLYGISIKHII